MQDAILEQNIRKVLENDTRVTSRIAIKADNCRVCLAGDVKSHRERQAAEQLAMQVSGVLTVQNNLDVEVSSVADDVLQEHVTNRIMLDPDITGEIEIACENGVVSIKRTIDSYWRKHLCETIALTTLGVRAVRNELAVVPSHTIEDQAIAEQLMEALSNSLHTNAENIDVEVDDGRVHLSGHVPTWAACEEVFETALHIPGVSHINREQLMWDKMEARRKATRRRMNGSMTSAADWAGAIREAWMRTNS